MGIEMDDFRKSYTESLIQNSRFTGRGENSIDKMLGGSYVGSTIETLASDISGTVEDFLARQNAALKKIIDVNEELIRNGATTIGEAKKKIGNAIMTVVRGGKYDGISAGGKESCCGKFNAGLTSYGIRGGGDASEVIITTNFVAGACESLFLGGLEVKNQAVLLFAGISKLVDMLKDKMKSDKSLKGADKKNLETYIITLTSLQNMLKNMEKYIDKDTKNFEEMVKEITKMSPQDFMKEIKHAGETFDKQKGFVMSMKLLAPLRFYSDSLTKALATLKLSADDYKSMTKDEHEFHAKLNKYILENREKLGTNYEKIGKAMEVLNALSGFNFEKAKEQQAKQSNPEPFVGAGKCAAAEPVVAKSTPYSGVKFSGGEDIFGGKLLDLDRELEQISQTGTMFKYPFEQAFKEENEKLIKKLVTLSKEAVDDFYKADGINDNAKLYKFIEMLNGLKFYNTDSDELMKLFWEKPNDYSNDYNKTSFLLLLDSIIAAGKEISNMVGPNFQKFIQAISEYRDFVDKYTKKFKDFALTLKGGSPTCSGIDGEALYNKFLGGIAEGWSYSFTDVLNNFSNAILSSTMINSIKKSTSMLEEFNKDQTQMIQKVFGNELLSIQNYFEGISNNLVEFRQAPLPVTVAKRCIQDNLAGVISLYRAAQAINERLTYYQVNISKHPEKAKDLIQLISKVSLDIGMFSGGDEGELESLGKFVKYFQLESICKAETPAATTITGNDYLTDKKYSVFPKSSTSKNTHYETPVLIMATADGSIKKRNFPDGIANAYNGGTDFPARPVGKDKSPNGYYIDNIKFLSESDCMLMYQEAKALLAKSATELPSIRNLFSLFDNIDKVYGNAEKEFSVKIGTIYNYLIKYVVNTTMYPVMQECPSNDKKIIATHIGLRKFGQDVVCMYKNYPGKELYNLNVRTAGDFTKQKIHTDADEVPFNSEYKDKRVPVIIDSVESDSRSVEDFKKIMNKCDILSVMMVKSMYSKIMGNLALFKVINMSGVANNLPYNQVRAIFGGFAEKIIQTPQIVDSNVELYVRLYLYVLFYKKLFFEQHGDDLKGNSKRMGLIPGRGPFARLTDLIFVKEFSNVLSSTSTFPVNTLYSYISICNELAASYQEQNPTIKAIKIVSDFVEDVNKRYGLVSTTSLKRFMEKQKEKKYPGVESLVSRTIASSKKHNVYRTPSIKLDGEDDPIDKPAVPTDISFSDTMVGRQLSLFEPKNRDNERFHFDEILATVYNFRKNLDKMLSGMNSKFKNRNSDVTRSLTLHNKIYAIQQKVKSVSSNKEKYDSLVDFFKTFTGVDTELGDEKGIMYFQLVATPMTLLQHLYEILFAHVGLYGRPRYNNPLNINLHLYDLGSQNTDLVRIVKSNDVPRLDFSVLAEVCQTTLEQMMKYHQQLSLVLTDTSKTNSEAVIVNLVNLHNELFHENGPLAEKNIHYSNIVLNPAVDYNEFIGVGRKYMPAAGENAFELINDRDSVPVDDDIYKLKDPRTRSVAEDPKNSAKILPDIYLDMLSVNFSPKNPYQLFEYLLACMYRMYYDDFGFIYSKIFEDFVAQLSSNISFADYNIDMYNYDGPLFGDMTSHFEKDMPFSTKMGGVIRLLHKFKNAKGKELLQYDYSSLPPEYVKRIDNYAGLFILLFGHIARMCHIQIQFLLRNQYAGGDNGFHNEEIYAGINDQASLNTQFDKWKLRRLVGAGVLSDNQIAQAKKIYDTQPNMRQSVGFGALMDFIAANESLDLDDDFYSGNDDNPQSAAIRELQNMVDSYAANNATSDGADQYGTEDMYADLLSDLPLDTSPKDTPGIPSEDKPAPVVATVVKTTQVKTYVLDALFFSNRDPKENNNTNMMLNSLAVGLFMFSGNNSNHSDAEITSHLNMIDIISKSMPRTGSAKVATDSGETRISKLMIDDAIINTFNGYISRTPLYEKIYKDCGGSLLITDKTYGSNPSGGKCELWEYFAKLPYIIPSVYTFGNKFLLSRVSFSAVWRYYTTAKVLTGNQFPKYAADVPFGEIIGEVYSKFVNVDDHSPFHINRRHSYYGAILKSMRGGFSFENGNEISPQLFSNLPRDDAYKLLADSSDKLFDVFTGIYCRNSPLILIKLSDGLLTPYFDGMVLGNIGQYKWMTNLAKDLCGTNKKSIAKLSRTVASNPDNYDPRYVANLNAIIDSFSGNIVDTTNCYVFISMDPVLDKELVCDMTVRFNTPLTDIVRRAPGGDTNISRQYIPGTLHPAYNKYRLDIRAVTPIFSATLAYFIDGDKRERRIHVNTIGEDFYMLCGIIQSSRVGGIMFSMEILNQVVRNYYKNGLVIPINPVFIKYEKQYELIEFDSGGFGIRHRESPSKSDDAPSQAQQNFDAAAKKDSAFELERGTIAGWFNDSHGFVWDMLRNLVDTNLLDALEQRDMSFLGFVLDPDQLASFVVGCKLYFTKTNNISSIMKGMGEDKTFYVSDYVAYLDTKPLMGEHNLAGELFKIIKNGAVNNSVIISGGEGEEDYDELKKVVNKSKLTISRAGAAELDGLDSAILLESIPELNAKESHVIDDIHKYLTDNGVTIVARKKIKNIVPKKKYKENRDDLIGCGHELIDAMNEFKQNKGSSGEKKKYNAAVQKTRKKISDICIKIAADIDESSQLVCRGLEYNVKNDLKKTIRKLAEMEAYVAEHGKISKEREKLFNEYNAELAELAELTKALTAQTDIVTNLDETGDKVGETKKLNEIDKTAKEKMASVDSDIEKLNDLKDKLAEMEQNKLYTENQNGPKIAIPALKRLLIELNKFVVIEDDSDSDSDIEIDTSKGLEKVDDGIGKGIGSKLTDKRAISVSAGQYVEPKYVSLHKMFIPKLTKLLNSGGLFTSVDYDKLLEKSQQMYSLIKILYDRSKIADGGDVKLLEENNIPMDTILDYWMTLLYVSKDIVSMSYLGSVGMKVDKAKFEAKIDECSKKFLAFPGKSKLDSTSYNADEDNNMVDLTCAYIKSVIPHTIGSLDLAVISRELDKTKKLSTSSHSDFDSILGDTSAQEQKMKHIKLENALKESGYSDSIIRAVLGTKVNNISRSLVKKIYDKKYFADLYPGSKKTNVLDSLPQPKDSSGNPVIKQHFPSASAGSASSAVIVDEYQSYMIFKDGTDMKCIYDNLQVTGITTQDMINRAKNGLLYSTIMIKSWAKIYGAVSVPPKYLDSDSGITSLDGVFTSHQERVAPLSFSVLLLTDALGGGKNIRRDPRDDPEVNGDYVRNIRGLDKLFFGNLRPLYNAIRIFLTSDKSQIISSDSFSWLKSLVVRNMQQTMGMPPNPQLLPDFNLYMQNIGKLSKYLFEYKFKSMFSNQFPVKHNLVCPKLNISVKLNPAISATTTDEKRDVLFYNFSITLMAQFGIDLKIDFLNYVVDVNRGINISNLMPVIDLGIITPDIKKYITTDTINTPSASASSLDDSMTENILDCGIFPINPNALNREIPLADLYNGTYSFDVIADWLVTNNKQLQMYMIDPLGLYLINYSNQKLRVVSRAQKGIKGNVISKIATLDSDAGHYPADAFEKESVNDFTRSMPEIVVSYPQGPKYRSVLQNAVPIRQEMTSSSTAVFSLPMKLIKQYFIEQKLDGTISNKSVGVDTECQQILLGLSTYSDILVGTIIGKFKQEVSEERKNKILPPVAKGTEILLD